MIICLPQIVLIDKEHGIPVVAFVFLWSFFFFFLHDSVDPVSRDFYFIGNNWQIIKL